MKRLVRKSKLSKEIMEYINEKFEQDSNLDINKIKQVLNASGKNFTKDQLNIIFDCNEESIANFAIRLLELNVPTDQVRNYVSKFPYRGLEMIVSGFERGLTIEQVNLFANDKFNWKDGETMFFAKDIIYGFIKGLSIEQVKVYADLKFSQSQRREIYNGLIHDNLTIEQVKIYADTKFDYSQMEAIREGLGYYNLPIEQVKVYANPKFDDEQMKEIRKGFNNGLTMDQVKLYANSDFGWYKMEAIREDLEKGLSIKKVKENIKNNEY